MATVELIGIDPGFAHLGIVLAELLPGELRLVDMDVVVTQKSHRKREIKATDDNVRRTIEIAEALESWLTDGAVAICSESQSWPRNSAACAKLGMVWGVVSTLSMTWQVPVLQSTPQEIKQSVTGSKVASKEEVIAAIEQRFPNAKWPKQTTLREHAADAAAAIISCLSHPTIQLAKRMLSQAEEKHLALVPATDPRGSRAKP